MSRRRSSPGLAEVLSRRRSQEGLLTSSHLSISARPILKRQPHSVRPITRRLGSVGDATSAGDWLNTGGISTRRSKSSEDSSSGPCTPASTPCYSASSVMSVFSGLGKIRRRQESVTYEESIPVIVRRRGCTMTVRIVSVDDIDDDDDDIDELKTGIPKTPSIHRGSLSHSLTVMPSRSTTPSPRSLSSLSLPQVRN